MSSSIAPGTPIRCRGKIAVRPLPPTVGQGRRVLDLVWPVGTPSAQVRPGVELRVLATQGHTALASRTLNSDDMNMGYAQRVVYRKPSWLRRQVNRGAAWLAGVGLTPVNTVRLEVRGRKTGRVRAFAVTTAAWRGDNYLVSLAGESDWVRNLRAADGNAVIRHGYRNRVRTEEIPAQRRAPVLGAYLEKRAFSKSPSSEARDYFGLEPHPPLEELERIAERYPVFKIVPAD